LKGRYDQSEVKEIIGSCENFMGSRMHACIAALSQNIPTIGLAYSRKFIGVFESVGYKNVLDMRELGKNKGIEMVLDLLQKNSSEKKTIMNEVQSAQEDILEKFKNIFLGL